LVEIGPVVYEKKNFKIFLWKADKPPGRGHFGTGGHNLKESEEGPPKERSCVI